MLKRRLLLSSLASVSVAATMPRLLLAAANDGEVIGLRGALDAAGHGIQPNRRRDQSAALMALLREAAAKGRPVFLQPGTYAVSTLTLPDGAYLAGVAGATRLVFTGGGQGLIAENIERLTLSDLVLDGAGFALAESSLGLVTLRGVRDVSLNTLDVTASGRHGIHTERCGGKIGGNRVSTAALAGIYAVDSVGMSITDNTVFDCGNGGILVHRWEAGEDGTMISGNRIYDIAATQGGTGENGNGINLYRAANVMVTANHISGCAFSAIRANAATNVQISDNQCLRSGETAIYSEFGFQGAIVSSNLIDGAANGILIVNFDEGGRLATVSDNIVRNLTLEGPYVHDGAGFGFGIAVEADTVVSGNVVEAAPRYGLMFGWGPYMRNIVATGNLVRSAGVGCAVTVVEGAGSALIADNLFQDVADGAILGYRWNEVATKELVLPGGEAFAHLTLSGNRLVGG